MNKTKAVILDGKILAEKIKLELKREIKEKNLNLNLATILIGDNKASQLYVNLKEKACKEVGITFSKYLCNKQCYDDIDETELLEMINFLNQDNGIDGILIQLPLPDKFETDKIIKKINPNKDVDGFINNKITPPTIAAIIELLKSTKEKMSDKKTIIIGKSDIFIDKLENYLIKLGIKDIKKEKKIPINCNDYDIIIIALGQAYVLKKEDVKEGAIVIDVGINKLNGITVGDADPEVKDKAGFISPVPGGVGPLTVAYLLRNVWELKKINNLI